MSFTCVLTRDLLAVKGQSHCCTAVKECNDNHAQQLYHALSVLDTGSLLWPAISDGWWSESSSERKRWATSICPGWGRSIWMSEWEETENEKNEKGWPKCRIVHLKENASLVLRGCCSPLSKALVVPFSTSRVRAAMMSAWRAMAWARSMASAPREVIIWVPLIRARPCEGREEHCPPYDNYIMMCNCHVNNVNILLNSVPERKHKGFPMNPGLIFLCNQFQTNRRVCVAGLKHYLFRPEWYWLQSMGLQDLDKDEREKNIVKGRGSSKVKHVFLLTFVTFYSHKQNTNFPIFTTMTNSSSSYIFGICPSTLWGPHFTLSHQPQSQMREWGQVSAGTHCSLLWDKGEAGSWGGQSKIHKKSQVTVRFPNRYPLSQ